MCFTQRHTSSLRLFILRCVYAQQRWVAFVENGAALKGLLLSCIYRTDCFQLHFGTPVVLKKFVFDSGMMVFGLLPQFKGHSIRQWCSHWPQAKRPPLRDPPPLPMHLKDLAEVRFSVNWWACRCNKLPKHCGTHHRQQDKQIKHKRSGFTVASLRNKMGHDTA